MKKIYVDNQAGSNLLKAKIKNFKLIVGGFAALLLIVPLFWMASLKIEGVAPVIRLERSSLSFGMWKFGWISTASG